MPTYNFQEVTLRAEKSGKCGCGKRRTRREKFWQTLNPFNKNADGLPKTAQEIRVELAARAEAWRAEPITCDDCRPSAQSCASGNVQFRSHAALNPSTGVGEGGS